MAAFNHFSPFHLSVPCIIFGDLLHDQKLFDLRIYAYEPGKLRSSEGLMVESTLDADELAHADIIIVPSWRDPAEKPDQSLLDALATTYSRGSQIVGLCLGNLCAGACRFAEKPQSFDPLGIRAGFHAPFPGCEAGQ